METWEKVVKDLVGKPFLWLGRGPESFDCWGLVQEVSRRLELPVPPDYDYLLTADVPETVVAGLRAPQAVPQERPEPGDVVLLSCRRALHHAGILTPYGVLHTTRRLGCVIMPEASLRASGYQRIEYYRWVP